MRVSLILIFYFLIAGCKKDDTLQNYLLSIDYPTTYKTLSASDYNLLKEKYLADKDCNFRSTLNSFGFCSFPVDYVSPCSTVCLPLRKDRARRLAMEFIQTNKKFLGVVDTSQIDNAVFNAYDSGLVCNWTDSVRWRVNVGNQIFNSIEIVDSQFGITLNNNGVTDAIGNWYPTVTVPEKDLITYEDAKNLLVGKSFDFMCWTNIHINITNNTMWEEPTSRKIIYPIKTDNTIELHVVWVLWANESEFWVDVMTGKVVNSHLRFIC